MATRRHWSSNFVRRMVTEKPLGAVSAVVTLLLLLVGIFADALAPFGMNETHLEDALQPPSAEYWLGTDNLGRDLLSRIIFGARISMVVGLAAAAFAAVLATILGILSGYLSGRFDLVVQRFVDVVMSFPGVVFLIVLISIVGPGLWQVIIAMGIRTGILSSRIVRSAVIDIRDNMYVQAARAVGGSTRRILVRHVLPNIMAPIIIIFSLRVPAAILNEASLSFLGFGIPAPAPSWGGMLSGSARTYMFQAPWMALWPGLALSIVVYSVNMSGDAVRDIRTSPRRT